MKNTGDLDFSGQKPRSGGEAPGHPEVKPTRMPGAQNPYNGSKGVPATGPKPKSGK